MQKFIGLQKLNMELEKVSKTVYCENQKNMITVIFNKSQFFNFLLLLNNE